MTKNVLLGKLLTLQQDGQSAISGPSNWLQPIILEVQTGLHEVVDELERVVIPDAEQRQMGRWHFFVGSPGNGKSAGAGALARRLDARGDTILDHATKKNLRDLSPSEVPYRLEVYKEGQNFPYLYIAQDASVLPDPYDSDADPALALEELLIEAAQRGVSVVVCTNRGVIERAFSRGYLDPEKNGEGWFKAIRMAVGTESPGLINLGPPLRKRVFDEIDVGVTSLDQRSMVLGSDILDRLILTAIEAPEWEACNGCASKGMCPFRANRDWLVNPELRKNVLRLFLHAELYDGQVIVLREALALISLLLAGCPHDYNSGPCDWVHQRLDAGDIFALASRRLYMVLFSSYSPSGLAIDREDREIQIDDLKSLSKAGAGTNDHTNRSLKFVVSGRHGTSTDVGVQRLLGRGRVFSALDPFADVLPSDFLDRWNESWTELESGKEWLSNIERACFACWDDMQKAAAASLDSSPTVYRWLTRWITSFTLRAGALVEGITTFGDDLDELASILSISGPPNAQQMVLLQKIETTLAHSLNPASEGLMLSPTTSLHGDWAKQALKPQVSTGGDRAITAHLTFGDPNGVKIPMSTRAFIWLKRKAERAMASETFPNEYLETARDAMLRVAVTSAYDTKDGIEIKVTRATGSTIQIKRSHGGMFIDVI